MNRTLRADAAANRERILRAAKAVFGEQGIDAEIKDIAERAGLGVGTIYRNFPGKHDLLIEILRGMMGDVSAALGEGEAEEDPIAGIRLALQRMYEVAERHGWLMEAKITGRLPAEVRDSIPPPHQDRRFEALVRMLDRGKEAGAIRSDVDTQVTIVLLFATIYTLTYGPARGGRSTAELAATVLDQVLHGVGASVVTRNPSLTV
jgi:AcrR family transcriptional regulator